MPRVIVSSGASVENVSSRNALGATMFDAEH
jgi:hypothetical protein